MCTEPLVSRFRPRANVVEQKVHTQCRLELCSNHYYLQCHIMPSTSQSLTHYMVYVT